MKTKASCTFVPEDVLTAADEIDLDIGEEQAATWLANHAKYIEEAMSTAGWDAIATLLLGSKSEARKG